MRGVFSVLSILFLLSHVTSATLADDPPAGIDPAVAHCIDAKMQARKSDTTFGDQSWLTTTYGYDDQAKCLFDLERYAESADEWNLYKQQLDSKPDASPVRQADYLMGLARDYAALGRKNEAVDLMNQYFDIAHGGILFDRALYLSLTKGITTPGKVENRRYLKALPPAMRAVILREGGTPDYNEDARPCHVSKFESADSTKVTWSFCLGFSNKPYRIYDFTNGKLTSIYTP